MSTILIKFFRRQWFLSYAALKRQSKNFQRVHNQHHRYSCFKGSTPLGIVQATENNSVTLGPNTKLPKLDYVPDGNITAIRFIRRNRELNIFGEKFLLSKELICSYVKTVIVTEINSLQIYLCDELVDQFDYQLTA